MSWIAKICRELAAENSGSEIAEAAAVLPLMFMLLLGIFWFGQAFSIYGTITQAAREGARAGAAPTCTTCGGATTPTANAWAAVQTTMKAAHLDPSNAAWPATPPTMNSCASGGGTVSCDTNNSNICVQQNVKLTNSVSASAGALCGVSVSLQYPYQFWLPFTTLNLQQIQLPASASVRMETQ